MKSIRIQEIKVLTIFGVVLFIVCLAFFSPKTKISEMISTNLTGSGTIADPFLIDNAQDLLWISEEVNAGNEFNDCYFCQTSNIDMNEIENWIPIGNDQFSFGGIYEGNGYYLKNLNIENENAALFYTLNGAICNLGIESGRIEGTRCASFAIFQKSSDAAIIDCYSKAQLIGDYVGGIANCFWSGKIICCWSDCEIISDNSYGIICDGTDVKLYSCRSTSNMLFPELMSGNECYSKSMDELCQKKEIGRFNRYIALAQGLFADKYKVKLKLLSQNMDFDSNRTLVETYEFVNEWTFPVIALLFVVVLFRKFLNRKKEHWLTILFIVSTITLFSDVFAIYLGIKNLKISQFIYLFAINYIFLISFYSVIENRKFNMADILHKNRFMLGVVGIVLFVEILQFHDMPHFDGTLYYGSLVRSIDECRLNLSTYLGAFVCWKEIHGLALFLAPWECLFHGEMIGLYIGNIVISAITIYFFFDLFRILYDGLDDVLISLFCICFFFFPYAVGLFTYFCMDYQLPLFAIWLVYGIVKENDILISFCGFLLSFTKITGFVFYVIVIAGYVVLNIVGNKGFKNQKKYQTRVIYWLLPVIEFLFMYKYSGSLAIQNFFGSYHTDKPIALKNVTEFICTIDQSFIYGFRWLVLLMLVIAVINIYFDKSDASGLGVHGKRIVMSVCGGCISVVCLLLVYNGDAMCPRYTAILNVGYILILPVAICNLLRKTKTGTRFVAAAMCVLMIIQTYVNVDPAMCMNHAIDLGNSKIYAGVPPYISTIEWNDQTVLNDNYVYNYQHNAYGNLMNEVFAQINPVEDQKFYVLDAHEYELNIVGSWNRNYKIYWNSKKKRFNFDEWDKYAHYLNVANITTDAICNGSNLEEEFFLILPSRVNREVIDLLSEQYRIEQRYTAENIYANLEIIYFKHK